MALPVKASLTPREELLALQKRIFRQNNRVIQTEAIVEEPEFVHYERRYRRAVAKYQSIAKIEDVLQAIETADIVYLGDYHTNPQSQRTLLRLLKQLSGRVADIGLCLEQVQDVYQPELDRFLMERISEQTFLRRTKFKEYWYFDLWENFKPIFDFSRYHRIPVFGVESAVAHMQGLKFRDAKSAEIIANLVQKYPGRKWIVFVGDLHVAPSHLPAEVDKRLRVHNIKPAKLILYQNSENIYWKLAEQKKEERVEVVKINDQSFCFMNTPPIIWQQTYLNWLEHEGETIDYVDAKYTVQELLERMAEFLGINLPEDYEEFDVFTCGDLSFLEALKGDGSFSRLELETIKYQILSSESYCIPRCRYIYLANMSINHAGEEASHYLKSLCSGLEFERPLSDAFYANIMHEAIGFFGSKVINHKRKSMREFELKGMIEYLHSVALSPERRIDLEIAQLVLQHKKLELRKYPRPYEESVPHQTQVFLGATHILGYMLGERLYHGLMANVIQKAAVKELYLNPMKKEGDAFALYIDLVKRLKGVKLPRPL